MSPRRTLLLALGAAALGGGLFLAFRPKPIAVDTATVTRGRFVATVEDDGRTRVHDRYVVAAPLTGRVLRLPVRTGDVVSQDQVVATILPSLPALLDPKARRELEERIGAAEAVIAETSAQVERARALLGQAQAEAQRSRLLRQSGVAAAQQFERAELASITAERELRAAELRRHAAEHVLDQTRVLLRRFDDPEASDRLEVTSPVAGRVLRVIRSSEAPVVAGEPLLEIGDPGNLEIIVDVLTTEAVSIRPGASVVIERWGAPEPLEGRVRLVESSAFTKVSALGVAEQRVWVVIDLVSPRERWTGLGDGFRVDARITVAEIEDAVLVPVSALFRRAGGWAVFVVRDGVALERRVELARRGTPLAAVAAGLVPGEQVVVFPPSTLAERARVRSSR